MQRRAVVVLIVFAVLAGTLAALLWREGEPLQPPGPGRDDADRAEAGRGRATDAAPSQLPAEAPHVSIAVTARERFVPPPVANVRAMLSDGRPLATATLAGVGAGFDAAPEPRGAAMVSIALGEGDLLRQVGVAPDTAPYVVGPRIVMRGHVLSRERQPVAGAQVWFGERDADGLLREVRSDDEGHFECDVPAGSGVPFVVRADGHAWTWRPIVVDTAGGELSVLLQPSCELQVQLAALATQMNTARAFVVPAGEVSSELAHWPFFLAALDGGVPVDARGEARIVGLPRAAVVGVVIVHPLAPLAAAKSVVLKAERERVVVPLQLAMARRRGAVVDEQGQPLVDVSLWLRPNGSTLADAGSSRLLAPHLLVRDASAGRSGNDGGFELGVPDATELLLSLRALGHAGRDLRIDAGTEAAIVLPRWNGGDAALRVLPPTPAAWQVETDLGGGVRMDLAEGEAFVIALPYAGRFDVELILSMAGQLRGHRSMRDVMATGIVELAAPKPE